MKTILIIDDNAEFRALMGAILREAGWRVLEAGDGESGQEIARQQHPQIILCDLLMPRGNGFQVCRAVRADSALRDIKIVIASGREYDADRHAAFDAGANAYLTKPVRSEIILKTINDLTASAKPAPAVVPRSGKTTPVRVKFWGVRGSIPTPGPGTVKFGGNTSCVEIRAGDEIIILDAGTGLRGLGQSLLAEFKGRPLNLTLLLTHTHWDHIQGLPFFAPIYQPDCRLRILGYEGARKSLVHVLSGQMESPYFPVPMQELPGNIQIEELKELQFQVGSVRVEAWFANHPGICVGYRLHTDDGSIAYIPDNEPIMRHRIETTFVKKNGREAVDFGTEEQTRMIEFLRGVDVLILDSQYDLAEYQQHVGWGHGCVDDAVDIALQAGAKKLFLFHHDTDHDDAKVAALVEHAQSLVTAKNGKLSVAAAREGELVNLATTSAKR